MSKLRLPRIGAAATRKGACDRSEIRFEGQRRIGKFEAIRSASLLRKSILEYDQRASTAAGLPIPIQIVCQCSNSNKIVFNQQVIFYGGATINGCPCSLWRHQPKNYARSKVA